MATNLTAARVRNFTCPDDKTQAFLWDTAAPGLGLRATRTGKVAYVFQFRVNDKTGRLVIGDVQSWDIEQARIEARRLQVLVDGDQDPRQVKADKVAAVTAKRTEEARQAMTLGELWPQYIEARKSGWGVHSLKDHYAAMQEQGLPRKRGTALTQAGGLWALRHLRLADLTAKRLEAWLKTEKTTRPTVTAKNYRLLRAFLNWASEHHKLGNVDALKADGVKRALPKGRAKDDALERGQLAAWFSEVRKGSNRSITAYLQAMLLTGARPGELIALRWQDVDFKWGSLSIRDKDNSKGGEDGTRTIPLTPFVAELLAGLPRLGDYVFYSPGSASGHITEPRYLHQRATAAAGLPHVTLHGLRRSFGTLSEWCEMPAGVVAQIQGHKPSATAEKHYRVRPLDLLRKWHTTFEAWILEQAGLEQPQSVEAAHGLRRVK